MYYTIRKWTFKTYPYVDGHAGEILLCEPHGRGEDVGGDVGPKLTPALYDAESYGDWPLDWPLNL